MTSSKEREAMLEVVEKLAQQWDGCEYDTPGGMIDIGDAIRQAGLPMVQACPLNSREADGWQPIETAPTEGRQMFVVQAFSRTLPSGRRYTSDPVCVWREPDGTFVRWHHFFKPTHWLRLPSLSQGEQP